MIKENTKAPALKLKLSNNLEYNIKSSVGKFILIYFYPKDDTPGCTLEAIEFNKLLNKFKKLNCEIYGISKDSVKSHEKFKKKYNLNFELLSDENLKIIKRYNFWAKKKFMGREFMGTIRSTVLIDKKGKILKIWRNIKVKNHAQEVLLTLQNIVKNKKAP